MRHGRAATGALLALAALASASIVPPPGVARDSTDTADTSSPADRAGPPNIVLVMTDDEDRADLRWMPKTRRLVGGHGVTFTHALSPDPLCCPARAEVLTGQLGQNNGVRENVGPHGGFDALVDKENTIASWLQAAGYQTALVGKYLNHYTSRDVRQSGWTIWNPTIGGEYSYTRTTFFDDGTPVTRTTNVTSAISRYTVSYINRFASTGMPFFIWVSHIAPHGRFGGSHFVPPLPTRRHRDDLRAVPAPMLSKPSFDHLGTRPWPYPSLAGQAQGRHHIQHEFTRRIESLLDVDDAVAAAVTALRRTGELDNTYLFVVSDNANLLGEHGVNGKGVLYREALEIPLVVRVPGATGARVSSMPVDLTDLTSTIVALASATPGRVQDGRSFAPVLGGGHVRVGDTQLIQTGDTRGGWSYRGAWTGRFNYLRRVSDGASFLYDHRHDPYELRNVAPLPAYHHVLVELRRRTSELGTCAGASCSRTFGALTPSQTPEEARPGRVRPP